MDLLARHPLDDWLAGWCRLWGVPGLERDIHVVVSSRMTRGLGRCLPRNGEIRLNRRLWDEPVALLREVLCHEAAHIAVERLHGRRARPHGPRWQRLMRQAGYEARARMDPSRLTPAFRARIVAGARARVLRRRLRFG